MSFLLLPFWFTMFSLEKALIGAFPNFYLKCEMKFYPFSMLFIAHFVCECVLWLDGALYFLFHGWKKVLSFNWNNYVLLWICWILKSINIFQFFFCSFEVKRNPTPGPHDQRFVLEVGGMWTFRNINFHPWYCNTIRNLEVTRLFCVHLFFHFYLGFKQSFSTGAWRSCIHVAYLDRISSVDWWLVSMVSFSSTRTDFVHVTVSNQKLCKLNAREVLFKWKQTCVVFVCWLRWECDIHCTTFDTWITFPTVTVSWRPTQHLQ